MIEIPLSSTDPRLLQSVVGPGRIEALVPAGEQLARRLDGASVICVNSTATGGGVAEMLQVLLPYARGVGVDARWLVIDGDAEFFTITKRLHNHLYGTPGDGGALDEDEHHHYQAVLRANAAELAAVIRPGDVALLHDPQTAGLAQALRAHGTRVVWRCHVGTDSSNSCTEIGWSFLQRYLDPSFVEAYVFTRRAFAPAWVPPDRIYEIPPSIDPFAPKNQPLTDEEAEAILTTVGLLAGPSRDASFTRPDGSRRHITRGADATRTGPPPDPDAPMVVQVSRWDYLKDMAGVMAGFADMVVQESDSQLVLAGPVVTAVADDPEGAKVLAECAEAWRQLPHHARQRITLACLPMSDAEENAIIVNALQRHATIVVQKSTAEGFGLTVSEAMYKHRPVIAGAVGGIVDQVVDGETGILLDDPSDLRAFGDAVAALLAQPDWAAKLGENGHERVVERFLPDTQLARWTALIDDLMGDDPPPE
jgi:trehalose synthase